MYRCHTQHWHSHRCTGEVNTHHLLPHHKRRILSLKLSAWMGRLRSQSTTAHHSCKELHLLWCIRQGRGWESSSSCCGAPVLCLHCWYHVRACVTNVSHCPTKPQSVYSTICSTHNYYHMSAGGSVILRSDRLSWGDDVWFSPGQQPDVECDIWCSEERRSWVCCQVL